MNAIATNYEGKLNSNAYCNGKNDGWITNSIYSFAGLGSLLNGHFKKFGCQPPQKTVVGTTQEFAAYCGKFAAPGFQVTTQLADSAQAIHLAGHSTTQATLIHNVGFRQT